MTHSNFLDFLNDNDWQSRMPNNWQMTQVGQVGEVDLGLQRSPQRSSGENMRPYIRAANITWTGLDLSDVLQMNFEQAEYERLLLNEGDIILAEASGSSRHVGRPAIWPKDLKGFCFQNTVIRFRAKHVLPEFALVVFQYYAESGAFERAARGVGIQHLSGDRFSKMAFPLPPLAEQRRIVVKVQTGNERLQNAKSQLAGAIQRVEALQKMLLVTAIQGGLGTNDNTDVVVQVPERAVKRPAVKAQRQPSVIAQPRLLIVEEDTSSALRSKLHEVLRRTGPLTAEILMAESGYRHDIPEEVNAFYDELRKALREKRVERAQGIGPGRLRAVSK